MNNSDEIKALFITVLDDLSGKLIDEFGSDGSMAAELKRMREVCRTRLNELLDIEDAQPHLRPLGKILVTLDYFKICLGLPEETMIHAVTDNREEAGVATVVEVVVEHPALKPIMLGTTIPYINPTVTVIDGKPAIKKWDE